MPETYTLEAIGRVESPLRDPADAPKQGGEGAPDAWLVLRAELAAGLDGLAVGDEVVVLTWLHEARRDVLTVHPRGDEANPETGVFRTRSPHRPNPIGIHRVRVLDLDGHRVQVSGLEAVDGTPVVDVKPVIGSTRVDRPPRTGAERRRDTQRRLERDVDAWIATADPAGGAPYLVPLSFLFDGQALVVSTPAASRTARNLVATGRARVGVGPTRNVVIVDGRVRTMNADEVADGIGDRFAQHTGFDPRALAGDYLYFRIVPERIQAWREDDELEGRDLMREGEWLGPG